MNGSEFKFDFITPNALNATIIVWFFVIVAACICVFTVGSYLWKRYLKNREFRFEMQTLGLDTEQEGTLAAIVKRYRMDEPMSILLSEQIFDEMATREMVRILSSPASAEIKEKYIGELYDIRQRTYQHECEAYEDSVAQSANTPTSNPAGA